MSFTPILSDQDISYAYNHYQYRNSIRETTEGWGIPVYYTPHDRPYGDPYRGFGGPKYLEGFNYYNSTSNIYGNCTWWCCGRLRETLNKNIMEYLGWQAPNGNRWYELFNGTKYTNANNAVAGDIISFAGGSDGHVMFIEKIENGMVYISHSAYSSRSYWQGYACRVNSYPISDIYAGNSINMYKDTGETYMVQVIGIIHTGEDPQPVRPKIPIFTRILNKRRKRGIINVKLLK